MSGQYDAYGSHQGRATIVPGSNLTHDGTSFRWPKCKGTASDGSYKVGDGFHAPADTVFSVYRAHGSGQIYNLIAEGYGSGGFYGNGPIRVFSLDSLKFLPEILEVRAPIVPVVVNPPTPILNLNPEPAKGKTYRIPTPPPVPLPMTAATVRTLEEKVKSSPTAPIISSPAVPAIPSGKLSYYVRRRPDSQVAYEFRYDLAIQRIMEDPDKWIRALREKTTYGVNRIRILNLLKTDGTTPNTDSVISVEKALEVRIGYLGSSTEEVPAVPWNQEALEFAIARVCRSMDTRYDAKGTFKSNLKGNLKEYTPVNPTHPFAKRFIEILTQSGISRSGFVRATGISPSTMYSTLGPNPTDRVIRTLFRIVQETCEYAPEIFDLDKPLPQSDVPILKIVRSRGRTSHHGNQIALPMSAAPAPAPTPAPALTLADATRVFRPVTDEEASAQAPAPKPSEPPKPDAPKNPVKSKKLAAHQVISVAKSEPITSAAEKHLSVAIELADDGRFHFRIRETGKVVLTTPGTSQTSELNTLRDIMSEMLNEGYSTALADIDRQE